MTETSKVTPSGEVLAQAAADAADKSESAAGPSAVSENDYFEFLLVA